MMSTTATPLSRGHCSIGIVKMFSRLRFQFKASNRSGVWYQSEADRKAIMEKMEEMKKKESSLFNKPVAPECSEMTLINQRKTSLPTLHQLGISIWLRIIIRYSLVTSYCVEKLTFYAYCPVVARNTRRNS